MHIETIVVGDFEVNCFVVWGEPRQALVVDPGQDADRILAALRKHQLTVAAYLLTHAHVDHISALGDLAGQCPAPIAAHPADLVWAFAPTNQLMPYYPPPRKPAPADFRELADGSDHTDGGLTYRVIATPGHTPGCVCYHFAGEKVLLSGDTLFADSVGRTDLPGGNARQLTASLKKLAALPDDTVVYPGHGPQTSIGQEKRTNFYMQRGIP